MGLPTVINSGVVVAREIELPDALENMGAQLLAQAAIRTSDPAKVTRSALENAASVAAMILTTEALVTDAPEQTNDEEIRRM